MCKFDRSPSDLPNYPAFPCDPIEYSLARTFSLSFSSELPGEKETACLNQTFCFFVFRGKDRDKAYAGRTICHSATATRSRVSAANPLSTHTKTRRFRKVDGIATIPLYALHRTSRTPCSLSLSISQRKVNLIVSPHGKPESHQRAQ